MTVKKIVLADLVMLIEHCMIKGRIKHRHDKIQHQGYLTTIRRSNGNVDLYINDQDRSRWSMWKIHEEDLVYRSEIDFAPVLELKNEHNRFYLPVGDWLEIDQNLREVAVATVDSENDGVFDLPAHDFDDKEDELRAHFKLPEIPRR